VVGHSNSKNIYFQMLSHMSYRHCR